MKGTEGERMTESTSDQLRRLDPLIEFAGCSVVEADAGHAVARQPAAPELGNHIGARHAGALFTVGYAASRALVTAAMGPHAEKLNAQMVESEIVYEKVAGAETVSATAEPAADDWQLQLTRVSEGEAADLQTAVTLRNEDEKTIMVMSVRWQVESSADGS